MDTQPLNREPAAPAPPGGEQPQRRWCSINGENTGMWVAIWVAIFVPMMSTADEPADLLWTVVVIGVMLAVGAGLYRLLKKRT
jgi:hypothetical protein